MESPGIDQHCDQSGTVINYLRLMGSITDNPDIRKHPLLLIFKEKSVVV